MGHRRGGGDFRRPSIDSALGGGGPRTPDIGGKASTRELGEAIAAEALR